MPFWPKHQPFRCQRALHTREPSRKRHIFDGSGGQKGNAVFSELRAYMYKGSQVPEGTSGVGINDEIITDVEQNRKKGEENKT